MKTIINTVTSYNTETGATKRAETIELYTFDELTDDAKERVYKDFEEERRNDPYYCQWFNDAYERPIWECVRDLENAIQGADVSWRYNTWYSCDFDCEYTYNDYASPDVIERVSDSGYYASMDICDAWNAHTRKLNAIYTHIDYIESLMWDMDTSFDYWNEYTAEDRIYNRLDSMRENLITRWYSELESACKDVRDTIETLLRDEWEYYDSEEAARIECEDETIQGGESYTCEYPYYKNGGYTGRVYYSDHRKWYTADGELYDESNVNHECVSIVKVA